MFTTFSVATVCSLRSLFDDDAMTIADDVDDDAKHRRREDESSSSAENVRTMMAPREASGERIVASKALDWGG